MKFKVVGKSLILTDYSHKITEGENSFDSVEIAVPRYHDDCDLSALSFRFSEISENGENSAVQVLSHTKCDEKYIYLKGTITSDFSAIAGKVIFMLTGVNGENVVAKFQSAPYTISDDISLTSLPNETTAEQLFNQAQLEVQKAIDAAERAEKASKLPASAEAYPATDEQLGGVLSGNDISVSNNGTVTVNSVNGKTLGKSVPADAVFTDTVYTLPQAAEETLGGILSGNDISVGDNGTVTVNSVNGKTIAKSVPADAVFTDTVYTLPKSTTSTLGGVKVDGKTITASEDGTISASDSEKLKAEIADIKSAQNSIADLSLQIAHPNNFLIYDNAGKPSVMVAIPKFYLDEVIDGASHTVHPAFIINGVEQEIIYISKYQNIVENGRAYSLPMKDPKVNVTFDQAYDYCKAKGKGWHLMTNAEWAAIALWCKKNGTLPKGNNNFGKDISENLQKAIPASYDSNSTINHIATGSGPTAWYHDSSFSGIADLNGNVWEWNSGMRLIDGEIQIIAYNDAADFDNSVSADSTSWKAIMPNGTLVEPNTAGTIKYDTASSSTLFANINTIPSTVNSGTVILEALGLIPHTDSKSTDYGDDAAWINFNGERISLKGGAWNDKFNAGIWGLNLRDLRTNSNVYIGFRSAFYGNV